MCPITGDQAPQGGPGGAGHDGNPPCSRQIGRENNTWISTLGIPQRFCASTEIGRLGEGRPGAYPVASISQPSRFSKGADLGIIRTPLLRLALRT